MFCISVRNFKATFAGSGHSYEIMLAFFGFLWYFEESTGPHAVKRSMRLWMQNSKDKFLKWCNLKAKGCLFLCAALAADIMRMCTW